MDEVEREAVRRWSAAIREIEVLEPWWTESHWDEHYWDDVAKLVVTELEHVRNRHQARAALERALRITFESTKLESDNGFYRDHLDRRLKQIVELALSSTRGGRRRRLRMPVGRPVPRRA
ncbi:MAG: hypothetical protein KF703_16920 [Actinobacteria bacterium]|nr:hypothetical protein [Actinomycetota bacterium]